MARVDPFAALLIGDSLPMRLLYGLMETAAKTSVTVLLEGETGTGKELVARGIHAASARAARPFVALNCAALPEPLLESLLFGHRKGAFTGADRDQAGAFQTADTGTMLLDEIGDMPIGIQAKLLRVLQDGEVAPVGEQRTAKVDVRIIAATNRLLSSDVGKTFRPDLYYRLAVLTIAIPPLRARVPDIPLLAAMFLQRYAKEWGRRRANTLGGAALQALLAYPWPGNVRELENEIARAVAVAGDGVMICREQLAAHIAENASPPALDVTALVDAVMSGRVSFDQVVGHVEHALIQRAMAQAGGVMTQAAELLHTSRRRLAYLLFHRLEGGETAAQSLKLVVSDVEWRMICETLEETDGNREQAAKLLGVPRSTLNSKITRYQAQHPDAALPTPTKS